MDQRAQFGHKPIIHNGTWRQSNASRYIRKFQSRRSLLIWKIWGERLDGWTNEDFPTAKEPGEAESLEQLGKPISNTQRNRDLSDLDYRGSVMPPVKAVKSGLVQALSDEDKRTLVRWIDLGCPIDLDINKKQLGYGWLGDDKRPTLTLTIPAAGKNATFDRILIGAFDYYSGIKSESLSVTANFAIDGIPSGKNLADHFKKKSLGVWEFKLKNPISKLKSGTLNVKVKDLQGNWTEVNRTFSVR